MATLKQLIQIQSVIDNRAIAKDTIATLENNYYYSKSKGINIKFADMHIDHFLRSLKIDKVEKSLNDIQTVEIINKQKQTLKKIKRLLNE
jgi:uncharacterized protein (DUF305 family)